MTRYNLSENRPLRFVTLSALYASQGIPDAMVLIVFPGYLAAKGVSASAIGTFLAIAMLPNSAKLIVGPLIDRVTYLPMGRRRPWVMAGQMCIAISFFMLSFLGDPASHIPLFTAGAFAITLSTVFQDVATDSMVMDIVPTSEQGRANGVMWGSKTLGTALAGLIGAYLLSVAGFSAMAIGAAVMLVIVLAFVLLLRERACERILPWTRGEASAETISIQADNWPRILADLFQALKHPAAQRLIGTSMCIGLLAGLSGALLPVLIVQDLGWTDTVYSQTRSNLKLIAGIAGIGVGGLLVDFLGHRKTLLLLFSMMAIINGIMAFAYLSTPPLYYLAAYEFLLVFVFIAFFAATMRQCWQQIAATQFSFTMVWGNITLAIGAGLLGTISAVFGTQGAFLILAGISAVGAGLAIGLRFDEA